jgi:hypothetical protein
MASATASVSSHSSAVLRDVKGDISFCLFSIPWVTTENFPLLPGVFAPCEMPVRISTENELV